MREVGCKGKGGGIAMEEGVDVVRKVELRDEGTVGVVREEGMEVGLQGCS